MLEAILVDTNVDHLDYLPLQRSLDQLKYIIKELKSSPSPQEVQDKIARVIGAVGLSGASLLNGRIIKEDTSDMVKIPLLSSLKSTIKYRVVHLLLFDTALVIWSKDAKKTHYLFPLYGASIYEHVGMDGKVYGDITADCSQRCFKLYSPGGPRHGAVLWFKQQETKIDWLAALRKVCTVCVYAHFLETATSHLEQPALYQGVICTYTVHTICILFSLCQCIHLQVIYPFNPSVGYQ
jgi:hypothetical protein